MGQHGRAGHHAQTGLKAERQVGRIPEASLLRAEHHRSGRAPGEDAATGVGCQRGRPHRRPGERSEEVIGLATGQVDQVGFTDRLSISRVVGIGAPPNGDHFDLGAEAFEMPDTQGGPAQEDGLAVRPRCRRQERDPGPRSAAAGKQLGIDRRHRRKELTGADERHGSGHRPSLARDPAGVVLLASRRNAPPHWPP